MDRWIDMLAASYGMPRVVLLRELGTAVHLAREIARVIAKQQAEERAEAEEARIKKQQQEDEMRAYLAELKAEQEAMRAEQGAAPPPEESLLPTVPYEAPLPDAHPQNRFME